MSLRIFRFQPAFAAFVVATAAIGLAANAALFAIVDGVFLRRLPYAQADRLLYLELKPLDFFRMATDDLSRMVALQQRVIAASGFREFAAFSPDVIEEAAESSEEWRSVRAQRVTHNFFGTLGVDPALGRNFTKEDAESTPRSVILSHDLWTGRFGADPSVIGRVLRIPGSEGRGFCEVVGVMPEGFAFPHRVDLWVVGLPPRAPVGAGFVGRLADESTIASIRTHLPEMTITPLAEYVRPPNATMMAYLLTASVCLFLVAWLQVGSLLLSRLVRRVPELRVKIALGATTQRLSRECVGEALLLLLAAIAVACVATPLLHTVALRQLPESLTAGRAVGLGARSYLFLVLLGLAGTAVLSIVPMAVVRASRSVRFMKREDLGGRGATLRGFRHAIFLTQIAVVTVLVYLTTLVAFSYERVTSVDLGFKPEGLWGVTLPLFISPLGADRAATQALMSAHRVRIAQTIDALAAHPAIAALATTSFLPMETGGTEPALLRAERDPSARTIAGQRVHVSPGFTDTFGIALTSGREVLPSEASMISERAPEQFALANSALARHLASFGDPVGQVVIRAPFQRVRIVGVILDVRVERPDEPRTPALFMFTPSVAGGRQLLLRVRDGSGSPGPVVRDAVQAIWGTGTAADVQSVERSVRDATDDYRARVVLLSLMMLFSIPVSGLGLIGAVTHVCRDRRYEFAVRIALGATRGALRVLLLRQFGALSAVGLTAGVFAAVAIGSAMSVFLFGVSATDPAIVAFVAVVMTAMVVAAVLIPLGLIVSPGREVMALKEE